MWGFNIDKNICSRYLEADSRWYMPLNELMNHPSSSNQLEEDESQLEEVQKNDVVIRWNAQWKQMEEIKNVKHIYVVYGSTAMTSMNFMDSQLTLVGVMASLSYCEYYCKDMLKETTKPLETVTCIYALTSDMTSLLIMLGDKSFYPQKAYLLCDLLFRDLKPSVKIVIVHIDRPKTSALAYSNELKIPNTSFNIFYVKSKQCSNMFGDQFAPLPISYLIAGLPAAMLTYCEIYNMDCILFQYVCDLSEEDLLLRSDYFYGFLSLLNPIFKAKIDKDKLLSSSSNSKPFPRELGDPKNQMFL